MTAEEAVDTMYNIISCLDTPCRRECQTCDYYVDRKTLKEACFTATKAISAIRILDENMAALRDEGKGGSGNDRR